MTTAVISSSFPLFPRLSLKLRDKIWRDSLPDKVGPALYIYREGCWGLRQLKETDEGYYPGLDYYNFTFEFRYDLLDDVQFDIPMAFVNREARDVALAWAREQGFRDTSS
ncbi:hypothetical protein F5Y06DRAFT_298432 [Hypoxylon sp. FL0890]|nr:hypothetical protein F5Y06DRAFT_298432 [Hypoxylon sp. FL0890]